MRKQQFEIPFDQHALQCDSYQRTCNTLVLHGAGQSSRHRFSRLRQALAIKGIPSVSFDFIGHGETGGNLSGSSLKERTDQASAVICHACSEPLNLIGASMSGHTAIKLTEKFWVANLILLVPAVYTPRAYDLPFGPAFSAAIRSPGSWQHSDAFAILAAFQGHLLVVAAESDDVIPAAVAQKIHAAAASAATRCLHVVPGSRHLSLFPSEQAFSSVMGMIAERCRNHS